MKIAFLTDLKNHDRIIKSINRRKSSKKQLGEGYFTTQVAFSYLEIDWSFNDVRKIAMGIETWLHPCICWFCYWSWSCLEVPLHDCRQRWGRILGVLTFIFGIPSALSYGVLADVHFFGKTFFDVMNFLVSNLLMPFGALCLSLFTGYIFGKTLAMEELHLDETPWKQGLFQVWLFLLRFIIPIIIIVVFIAQFM